MKREKSKTNKLQSKKYKQKGITLIALVITIVVLMILAGISINLVLGENGLFQKAKSVSIAIQKAKFLEDARLSYLEAYTDIIEKTDSHIITIEDVVSRLKTSYGYTDEQIKMTSSEVTDIILSENSIKLKSGEIKQVIVTLANSSYYALIEDSYYPIILSDSKITLGEGVKNLPKGEVDTSTITATATSGSELIDLKIEGTIITITAQEGQVGEAIIEVRCGNITKAITVIVKSEVKKGDEVPLGEVKVTVNDVQQTLAQGWKYFYDDEENGKVWLIYSGIIEGTVQQTSGTIIKNENFVYSSSDRGDLFNYINGEGIYVGKWDHIKTGIKNALEAKKISIAEDQIQVKGSPDIELFQKAYAQMYPEEKLEIQRNNVGWLYRLGGTGNFETIITTNDASNKSLFFVANRYWLSSPNAGSWIGICSVHEYGALFCNYVNDNYLGIRPIVSIPKTVFQQLVEN